MSAFIEKKKWPERLEEFHDFLQGKLPTGVMIKERPKLSADQAWSVIWFLQECTRAMPDHYERCNECGVIYDSHSEGAYIESDGRHGRPKSDIGKCFCDNCLGW